MCLSARNCFSGVSLSAVFWAVQHAAQWFSAEVLTVSQGQTVHSTFLVLLTGMDFATPAGMEQVCFIAVFNPSVLTLVQASTNDQILREE